MKYFIFLIGLAFLSSCSVQKQGQSKTEYGWQDVVVIEDLEVFVDTTDIRQQNGLYYAYVKNVYTTDDSRAVYVNKIRKVFEKQGNKKADEKIKKWENFSYNIALYEFDCPNKRYRILEVTDYDKRGQKILATKPNKNTVNWVNVGIDTMGDYTLFFVCDYSD
ncbi:hypothetical protein D0T53_11600 [Dysgonomonas sp. 216]|uniref:surface-adhesin E family protein n=1 Tax=Dysgonomonas sp. 216 TaxID=2302934 RepID=UPI0013D130F3|nr:surface-adhesin E family protein [Dysgonomonas sp. 216]NDW19550.1 hypothetical protein [Dysgonomonas sp. 216]